MIGEIVNNYRITELLGEGGMGAVYLAEHPFMGRKAAIKVLRREFAEDPALVERFMNEARAANAIRHPNIIDIIDVGRMPSGIPYLMMEFLEGQSLAQRLARGTPGIPEALDVVLQTTSALAAAHGKGIVHRDLKPDNLFLVPDESAATGVRVKVLDFGIAKLRGDLSGGMAKTQAGSLMGTPPYMSPEQCRGVTEAIDQRTDVYAIGVILYEMLVGAPPFVAAGWGEIVLAHMIKPPVPPRARNADIPEAVEAAILKALEKEPERRFQTAAEMRAALRSLSSSGTFPPRPTASLGVAESAPAPMAAKQPTTFKTASGELAPIDTLADSSASLGKRRRPGVVIAGVAAAAAIALVVAIAVSGGKQTSVATPPAPAPAPAKPAASAIAEAPRETSAPVPAQILVRLGSEPAGALVTDAKHGVLIGATPLEQRVARKAGSLDVRVAKDGYSSVDLDIPLDGDFDKTVRLEPKPQGKSRHGSSHAATLKPNAVAKASAAAPSAPAPSPPVPPPPQAPKPKAEKW